MVDIESKKVMVLVRMLEERGHLNGESKAMKDSLINKLSLLEEKLSDVEFQSFEELLFKTFETIEDEFFELGLLLGSMLGEEIEYENK